MDKRESVARAIYTANVPCNMTIADWDSGTILGAENSHRKTVYRMADAAIEALDPMDKPRVKPLRWEHHPWGTIAAPPTGHAYIIDTRMNGRVYSLKGFNPQREFASMAEAKAAAQADYEARILAAIEPASVSVREAARVLYDMPEADRMKAWRATRDAPPEFAKWFCIALRAIAEGED